MKLILVIVGVLVASAAHAQNAPWCLQSSGESAQHCTYGSFSAVSSRAPGEWFLYSKLHISALHANHSAALTGRREAAMARSVCRDHRASSGPCEELTTVLLLSCRGCIRLLPDAVNTGWAMRRFLKVAALALLPILLAGQARATETEGKVITLSCE